VAFLPAFLFSHRSYPVDKGHINGLVSPQQILLVVYTHYIAIPVGQACQCLIEGQSGQDTYFRQYRSATRTASIVASSQLGANHPSCLISSSLARASSCDNGLISTPAATDGRRRPIHCVTRCGGTGLWPMREDSNWRKGATRCSKDDWRGGQRAFLLGVERMLKGCCGEPSLTERGRTRPLSRIVEAAKMRREPVLGSQ